MQSLIIFSKQFKEQLLIILGILFQKIWGSYKP
jgi:hypothetical protein